MLAGIDVSPLLEQSIEEERQLHLFGQLAAAWLIRRKTRRTLPRLRLRPIMIVVTSCHWLDFTLNHYIRNHLGELSVFDKSFLTSLSSLVNYLSTLEIFSLPGHRRLTALRHHPSLTAAEFQLRGDDRPRPAGAFPRPARLHSPGRADTENISFLKMKIFHFLNLN